MKNIIVTMVAAVAFLGICLPEEASACNLSGGIIICVINPPPPPPPPPPSSGAPKAAKGAKGGSNIAGALIAKEVGGIMIGGVVATLIAEKKMLQKGHCNGLTGNEIRTAFSGSTIATVFMVGFGVKDQPCQINQTQSKDMGPGVPGYEFSTSLDRSCTHYTEYKRRAMGYCNAYISRKCRRNKKFCQRAGGVLVKRHLRKARKRR